MDFGKLIIFVIGIVIAVSLTPTVSSVFHEVANDANASDLAKNIAPYGDVLYLCGVLSLIAGAGYSMFKKGK